MKNTIIFLIIIVLSFGFNPSPDSSDYHIKYGKAIKTKTYYNDYIGRIGEYFYTNSYKGNNTYILKIKNRQLVKKVKLILEYKGKFLRYHFSMIKNNKMYVFSSFYNSKMHKEFFFYQIFDTKTMTLTPDLHKIGAVPVKSRAQSGTMEYTTSPDSSKILIYLSNPDRGKQKQEVIFTVLDENFKRIWGKGSLLNYSDKNFKINYVAVNNDGTVFYAGKHYIKTSSKKNIQYKYHILIFDQKEDDYEDIEVKLNKNYIKNMVIRIANNNDIIFAGFYSPNEYSKIDGSFYMRLDGKTYELITDNYKEFPVSFITTGYTEKEKKKVKKKQKKGKNVQFKNFTLKRTVMRSDGGILLIAEQYYVESHTTYTQNGGSYTTYIYNNNDILIININPDGRITWNKKITKWQRSQNKWALSYVFASYANNIYFLINDNPKNRMHKVNEAGPANYYGNKDSDLILYKMNTKGEISKYFIGNTKNHKFLMSPSMSFFDNNAGVFHLFSIIPNKSFYPATLDIN
jgi:hypothetical protein